MLQTHPAHLTESQRRAREEFDLDAAMAALPPPQPPAPSERGAAGVRLRAGFASEISDELLREFVREVLGAQRISAGYLDALRIVLGNQANAERLGYLLEMNIRTRFASERTMRTIIDQMSAAGIANAVGVGLGKGKAQTVRVFPSALVDLAPAEDLIGHTDPAEQLSAIERAQEERDAVRMTASGAQTLPEDPHLWVMREEVHC